MDIQELANKVCEHIPEGHVIMIGMENGSAWVEIDGELVDHGEGVIKDQVNEALSRANGFTA